MHTLCALTNDVRFVCFYYFIFNKIMEQKLFCRVLDVEYNRIQDNY